MQDLNTILNNTLEFNYKQNKIKINFSCLDYYSAQALQYYAFVEGIDTGWVLLGNKPSLNFENTSPGYYKVNLKCRYQNGNWCEKITSFSFKILPPIYKRWWFIVLSLLSIIGLTISFFRWKNNEWKGQYLCQCSN